MYSLLKERRLNLPVSLPYAVNINFVSRVIKGDDIDMKVASYMI